MTSSPESNLSGAADVAALRARVDELEAQLLATEDWANRTVGAAQERAYWLDRWHLDLNALMRRRSASRIRVALRVARRVYRIWLTAKRRLSSAA